MRLPVPRDIGPVDYASATPPNEYHCGKCGVHGLAVSLERQVFRSRRSRIALYVLVFAVGVAYGLLSAIAATGWWI